jgi:hypothetical protein
MDALGYARISLSIFILVFGAILFKKRKHGIEILMMTYALDVILFYAQNYFSTLDPAGLQRWSAHIGVHALVIFAFYISEKLVLFHGLDRVHSNAAGDGGRM